MSPRRRVWQRIGPEAVVIRAQQESRKLSLKWASAGALSVRQLAPSTISIRHSLHLPCLRQEVGTRTPRDSAHSNREAPIAALVLWPLRFSSTLMHGLSQ